LGQERLGGRLRAGGQVEREIGELGELGGAAGVDELERGDRVFWNNAGVAAVDGNRVAFLGDGGVDEDLGVINRFTGGPRQLGARARARGRGVAVGKWGERVAVDWFTDSGRSRGP
jgi:hypothetical protein